MGETTFNLTQTSDMKPNKTRIKKLIAALRSGKYEQCTGRLRYNDKFCCLGVACEVYREVEGDEWSNVGLGFYFQSISTALPPKVIQWYGFNDSNPVISKVYSRDVPSRDAIGLNDSGKDFSYIADRFEETFIKGKV